MKKIIRRHLNEEDFQLIWKRICDINAMFYTIEDVSQKCLDYFSKTGRDEKTAKRIICKALLYLKATGIFSSPYRGVYADKRTAEELMKTNPEEYKERLGEFYKKYIKTIYTPAKMNRVWQANRERTAKRLATEAATMEEQKKKPKEVKTTTPNRFTYDSEDVDKVMAEGVLMLNRAAEHFLAASILCKNNRRKMAITNMATQVFQMIEDGSK